MVELLIVVVFIAVIGIKISSKDKFKSMGKTIGVCKEVRVEYSPKDGSPYNEQMRGMDERMYRPYIEYKWKGNTYIAKSYRAYSVSRIFPGDQVSVLVNECDKNIVKIVS